MASDKNNMADSRSQCYHQSLSVVEGDPERRIHVGIPEVHVGIPSGPILAPSMVHVGYGYLPWKVILCPVISEWSHISPLIKVQIRSK